MASVRVRHSALPSGPWCCSIASCPVPYFRLLQGFPSFWPCSMFLCCQSIFWVVFLVAVFHEYMHPGVSLGIFQLTAFVFDQRTSFVFGIRAQRWYVWVLVFGVFCHSWFYPDVSHPWFFWDTSSRRPESEIHLLSSEPKFRPHIRAWTALGPCTVLFWWYAGCPLQSRLVGVSGLHRVLYQFYVSHPLCKFLCLIWCLPGTWFNWCPFKVMFIWMSFLLMACTSVFEMLIFNPRFEVLWNTWLTMVWRSLAFSAIRTMSSGKRRFDITWPWFELLCWYYGLCIALPFQEVSWNPGERWRILGVRQLWC